MPSKASETSVRSPSSSLHSSELQCSNSWSAGRKPLVPTFFFFYLEQKLCCPAAYMQFHGSLLGAARSLLFVPHKRKQKFPMPEQPQRKLFPVALCSPTERNQTRKHLHWDLCNIILTMFHMVRFWGCFLLVSYFPDWLFWYFLIESMVYSVVMRIKSYNHAIP